MTEQPYLRKEMPSPYCKGCGHGLVLRALGEALARVSWPPGDLAIVTDIGCVGLADELFSTPHTVHTTHGRSTAFATGMALAEQVLGKGRLKPIVMIGDGGATIGINHLVNAALLNPDVTVLVHNNFLFGMTGGQNSAFSPLDFVTSTTPAGNAIPPLDLARVLIASRATFVARKLATDRDLGEIIARAIAHPGFAVVEILELCTAYATRWNPLTGAKLKEVADKAGYELGVLCEAPRPTFAQSCRERATATPERENAVASRQFTAELARPVRLVLAGTAGERVQTAASMLCHAAMLAGLEATQKNDNPVTQGTGFSVSEVILSREEILYTGIETPDAVLVVSAEGARELGRNGVFGRLSRATLVLADNEVELPELPAETERLPFRAAAGGKLATLAAVAHWLARSRVLPADAFWTALETRYGAEAAATKTTLAPFLAAI